MHVNFNFGMIPERDMSFRFLLPYGTRREVLEKETPAGIILFFKEG